MSGGARYFEFVDGLRAIAVLAVLVYHLEPSWLPGGYLGVDVFFVISGFVVSHSVSRFEGGLGRLLFGFYARRAGRILPALVGALVLTTAATVLLVPLAPFTEGHRPIAWAAHLGLSNWALLRESFGYFSASAELNPYTHTWSLGVEEQFYVAFPFLVFVGIATRRPWIASASYVVLAILSLAAAIALGGTRPEAAFYASPTRFWQLSLGILCYRWVSKAGDRPRLARLATPAIALLFVAVGSGHWGASARGVAWSSLGTMLACSVATAGLLVALGSNDRPHRVRAALTLRPARWIGKISYSLYLFHWPVAVLLKWTIGLAGLVAKALALASSVGLAAASFHGIEAPLRTLAARKHGKTITLLGGIALVVVSQRAVGAAFEHKAALSLSVTRDRDTWMPYARARGARVTEPCEPVVAVEARGGSVRVRIAPDAACARREAASPRLFVLGDSHAGTYGKAAEWLARERGLETTIWTHGGCPIAGGTLATARPRSAECAAFAEESRARILERARPSDVLLVSALRVPRLVGDGAGTPVAPGSDAGRALRRAAISQAQDDLAPYLGHGMLVLLEGPKPVFWIEPYRCMDGFNRKNPACAPGFEVPRAVLAPDRDAALADLEEIARGAVSVRVWPVFDALCPPSAASCSAIRGGEPLFFDGDHLSGRGSVALGELLARALVVPSG